MTAEPKEQLRKANVHKVHLDQERQSIRALLHELSQLARAMFQQPSPMQADQQGISGNAFVDIRQGRMSSS